MEFLARPSVQEMFTKSLIERALGRNISKDEYFCLNDGKWIKMANVFKYPYFKRAIEKVTDIFLSTEFFKQAVVPISNQLIGVIKKKKKETTTTKIRRP